METTIAAPVTFTNQAIKEISRLKSEEGFDKSNFLRVGVKGGGCSGMTYVLGFDQKLENDEVYDIEGLTFIMNKSHGIYLMGNQYRFFRPCAGVVRIDPERVPHLPAGRSDHIRWN